ncbi:4-alpha-glucanotransferase [Cetobacterium ceti]
MERGSGILLHITSLPNGILDKEAYKFIDFLEEIGCKYWQILPLGIPVMGLSPYQCLSGRGSNYYLLNEETIEKSYKEKLYNYKNFKDFKKSNPWTFDFALFLSLKEFFNNTPWYQWPFEYRYKNKNRIQKIKLLLKEKIDFFIFREFFFRETWKNLKEYGNSKGIKIIGDIPIYVAHDSFDLWMNSNLFLISKKGTLLKKAGVPGDYFNKNGQLWGNPIYNWKIMEKNKFSWWITLLKDKLNFYDYIRIDHFRGFESYWSIPGKSIKANNGKWKKGPGKKLLKNFRKYPLIGEDLGIITDKVRTLLKESNIPGMEVFQFNENIQSYEKNKIVYSGTHDNMTLKEWLLLNNRVENNFQIIEKLFDSKSDVVIIPMQDYLNLGKEGRMNTPGTKENNWLWKMEKDYYSRDLIEKITQLNKKYKRG